MGWPVTSGIPLDREFCQHLEAQKNTRENGMLNFGDWFHVEKFGGGWGTKNTIRRTSSLSSICALVTAYEMTGNDRYLDAAHRQWDVLREGLDPARGWVVMLAFGHCPMKNKRERCRGQVSYMLGLTFSALARYHQITGDPEVVETLTVGLDQIIRECWHEEAGSFYATACTHYHSQPPGPFSPTTTLAAQAFAHEIKQTGNQEHLRIFRKAFRNSMEAATAYVNSGDKQAQAAYQSRGFHFTPYSLRVVEE